MIVVGIDIGLTGAVAAVSVAVNSIGNADVRDMPVVADGKNGAHRIDGRALLLLLRELVPVGEAACIVFEDVRARPAGNGGAHGNTMHSQGSMMRSRGIVEAVADITRFEVHVVQPQTWKRHFGLLKTKKDASREIARALFPSLAHDLNRVKDHNRAESLLLAQYGMSL